MSATNLIQASLVYIQTMQVNPEQEVIKYIKFWGKLKNEYYEYLKS